MVQADMEDVDPFLKDPGRSIIKEFRITLPVSVEEYQVGQLYSVVEASKAETGGNDGVEVQVNEPYTDYPSHRKDLKRMGLKPDLPPGQYTKKIYHLENKVGSWIKAAAPKGALSLTEEAWNAYPYCKTVLTNPDYMGEGFRIHITTWHKPDRGESDNVHELPKGKLDKREVIYIDIANDTVNSGDYKAEYDPKLYTKERGPLTDPTWRKSCQPYMTCYKLVEVKFDWPTLRWIGLEGKIRKFIGTVEQRLFTNFHRQLFCTHFQWGHMNMKDIRELEETTKSELDELRKHGAVRGAVCE